MSENLTLDHARRWAAMPKMAPEVEKRAALEAIGFLRDVAERLEQETAAIREGRAPADGSGSMPSGTFRLLRPKRLIF